LTEYRRILLNGAVTRVRREGDMLLSPDGRTVSVADAVHLAPTEPSKIIACHLNYRSRVEEFMTKLPPAPTYFHKPTTALNSHGGDVVRPERCKYLNFEGEIAIVIGAPPATSTRADAGSVIAGYTIANDYGLHDFRDTDAGSMLG
jgi:5-oxopent-3-ene-1,2,5-tricarboxylate decarboxylase / 2-hydroxyhepta-2,4-diene-1,7-dioate isomerase